MEAAASVPQHVSQELTQILANLVLGDNEIRSNAEKVVNERLAQSPELYILAVASFSITAPDEQMRAFSLILLRRLLFRPPQALPNSHATTASASSSSGPHAPRLTLYDHLSEQTRESLERTVLHALSTEQAHGVKTKAADTATDLANASFQRGRPWPALQGAVFRAVGGNSSSRECAYRILERCQVLVADMPSEIFVRGLADNSVEVRLAALKATVASLSIASPLSPSTAHSTLLGRALATLPAAPPSHTTRFLNVLTPLAGTHPTLFAPHFNDLLHFLPGIILNQKEYDAGPTPTVARPFPNGHGSVFQFPPTSKPSENRLDADDDDEKEETRRAALELMVSLSEARPSLARRVDGWLPALVRACLEGIAELPDDEETLASWLDADPTDDPTDATYPHVFEQALDRLSCAFSGSPILQIAFQYIPGMLASHDWRLRHGALMAIASMAEGGARVMEGELARVIALITNAFNDPHPRVRYAACQCTGQLCTDLEDIVQERHHTEVFGALLRTLNASEPRVHSHAAAALINVCEGVAHSTLLPYLDALVGALLRLLEPQVSPIDGKVKTYVQEQAVTTLAMVADASEGDFGRHYKTIMPLLMNVLRNAGSTGEHRKLRWKAMECAGLIAIAVGRDTFRPDSAEFIDLLMKIQNSPVDPGDTMLNHYLIATWAKVCQALGSEFEPYLPVVMPSLLHAANAKADVSVWDEDEEGASAEREGWETMSIDGQQVGIKTSGIEEKCQAFETLVVYASTLGARFAPYLPQSLELVLPGLKFFFHEGVREACAVAIPVLLVCGKQAGTLTPQMLHAVFAQLVSVARGEADASFLASLFRCIADCVRVAGGGAGSEPGTSPADALPRDIREGILGAIRHQLQGLADKRKARTRRFLSRDDGSHDGRVSAEELEEEREDIALLEELEDFALDDIGKLLKLFDPSHPLLVAVGSVRELGIREDEDNTE
ncbi:ARM repeat-containing protein [Sanghuangporus baumii]|uniref:ARM repeat-containing protein n=1 Tax=Sanghuangporus baumii TaxID=108892 RepID=A0A9Q5HRV4_SANBA|nr:ARM repeat-containing protein [Sanghuangporus baumii]